MTIEYPASVQIPALKRLWQRAFGDPDAFLEGFFQEGFAPERCRCAMERGQLAAALYWFDCEEKGQRFAYIYGVATDEAFRGRGICTALMEDTHALLKRTGYAGAALVPGSESLFRFYEKLGYAVCSSVQAFSCTAAEPVEITKLNVWEYAQRRRELLPEGGVVQEGATLEFLQTYASFYGGKDFLLAASVEGSTLIAHELLGNVQAAPGILGALGAVRGKFRAPGKKIPFAMYRPLIDNAPIPAYFGLALD